MKILRAITLAVAVSAGVVGIGSLGACTSVGLATPQSPAQTVAYGYSTISALRLQAAQGLASGAVSVVTAQKVLTLTDQARTALDAAEAVLVMGGDSSTVQGQLALAAGIIAQVQALLPVAKPL